MFEGSSLKIANAALKKISPVGLSQVVRVEQIKSTSTWNSKEPMGFYWLVIKYIHWMMKKTIFTWGNGWK